MSKAKPKHQDRRSIDSLTNDTGTEAEIQFGLGLVARQSACDAGMHRFVRLASLCEKAHHVADSILRGGRRRSRIKLVRGVPVFGLPDYGRPTTFEDVERIESDS